MLSLFDVTRINTYISLFNSNYIDIGCLQVECGPWELISVLHTLFFFGIDQSLNCHWIKTHNLQRTNCKLHAPHTTAGETLRSCRWRKTCRVLIDLLLHRLLLLPSLSGGGGGGEEPGLYY